MLVWVVVVVVIVLSDFPFLHSAFLFGVLAFRLSLMRAVQVTLLTPTPMPPKPVITSPPPPYLTFIVDLSIM